MSAFPELNEEDRDRLLKDHPNWELTREGKAINRVYQFDDFSEAWAFVTRVALIAHRQDHHPEWSNVFAKVDITLTTHDAGGLSTRDASMVRAIDSLTQD